MRTIQEIEVEVLSEMLRFMKENGQQDRDDYASKLAKLYVDLHVRFGNASFFQKKAENIQTNFYRANRAKKKNFIEGLSERLSRMRIRIPPELIELPPLSIVDIFPELKKIRDSRILNVERCVKIKEEIVQTSLRDALREKGASPIPRRGKDSPLEVADLEHFYMTVRNRRYSFSAVVKGYNSVSGKRISWEDVSHQVLKANRTKPNYILFLTAKDPKDGVISEIVSYSADINKPHLVIFVSPMDLAKFLVWRGISS